MNSHSFSSGSRSIVNDAWLTDPRWVRNTFYTYHGNYWLTLKTLPGVIGGVIGRCFSAYVDGIQPTFRGKAQVTITSIITESSRNFDRTPSATLVTDFLEVETIEVSGPRIDFEYLIPFQATCQRDGAVWTLTIEFSNGNSGLFEIPVYRTRDSDPALT